MMCLTLLAVLAVSGDPSLPALKDYREVAQFVANTGKSVKVSFGTAYHTSAADYSFASWPARCADGLYTLRKDEAGELWLHPEQPARSSVAPFFPPPSPCPNGRCPLQR